MDYAQFTGQSNWLNTLPSFSPQRSVGAQHFGTIVSSHVEAQQSTCSPKPELEIFEVFD